MRIFVKKSWSDADYALEVDAASVQGPSPYSKIMLILILLFFVVAGIWAWYAVVDEVTHADGKIIPSSRVQVIQNLEGGILKKILVTEGQLVKIGQVVMRIDDTGHSSSFGELKARYYSLIGEVTRLKAEAEERPLRFDAEMEKNHKRIVRDQIALYKARKLELKTQVAILQQQMDQRKQEKDELLGKSSQLLTSRKITQEEYAITAPLVKKMIVPKIDLLRLERQINDLEGEISAARLAMPRVESAINEAQQRIEEKSQHFKSASLAELSQRNMELAGVKETILGAKDKVARTEIRSPVRGVVKEIKISTVGGVIKPGEDLMEIVPLDDTLLVEARVRPADIAFLHAKQKARVKFSAYDFSIYGGLQGRLEQIGADTVLDDQGEAYYKVIIRTDKNHLTKGGESLPIIPGMVATVDIITGQKTILMYIMKPIIKAQQLALTER
ncbi:MAG: HlyD family type I secretion periplasmic adaptor subunit [Gammaproteobacteria bacterium]|nr:HlyD family type I secretion periplasmic adaptor subunit [Gammaproteobacteria bacterium]